MQERLRFRRIVKSLAAIIATVLTLAACGSSDAASGGDGPRDPGAILRYGVDLTPGGGPLFDPILNSKSLTPNQYSWLDLIFDRLIYQEQDGTISPGLLEEWETPDPLTLNLKLRPDLKFQDGTPLDAAALKFNWDRDMATPTLTKPVDFQRVTSIEVTDPLTVQLKYSEPAAAFTLNVTLTRAAGYGQIISPAAVEKYGDAVDASPVGAGPYKFDKLERGKVLSVRKWDGYWNPEGQNLAGVDFIQVARGPAAVSALIAGTIDISPIEQSDVDTVKNTPGLTAGSQAGSEVLYLYVNTTRAPFNDHAVREALAYAWDREAVNNAAYAGQGILTETHYYPESIGYVEELDNMYGYDADKAQDLMSKTDAEGTSITVLVQNIPRMVAAAEVIQAQMKAVGINMELNVSPNFVEEMSQKPDAVLASTITTSMPASFLLSKAVFSIGYNSPVYDEAVAEILGETDPEKALEAYATAQQALQEDLPIYFFAQEPISIGMSEKVHDVGAYRGDLEGPVIRQVYMTE